MNKKFMMIAALVSVAAASQAVPVWYGGDFDGVNGFISQDVAGAFSFTGMAYDDFNWNITGNADNIRGSIFVGNLADTQINWEIRQGMSAGTGTLGTLIASGTSTANYTFLTTAFGFNVYSMTAAITSTALVNGNTYQLGVQTRNTQGATSLGAVGTTGGANGLGSPVADGRAWQYNASANTVTALANDLSLGIGGTAVPEPATMAALGLGIAALLRRRRK